MRRVPELRCKGEQVECVFEKVLFSVLYCGGVCYDGVFCTCNKCKVVVGCVKGVFLTYL